jgi:hypothetical protein
MDYANIFNPDFTVYISGPMRGKPELNYPTFNAVAKVAAARGWKVFNPADEGNLPPDSGFNAFMRKDIGDILKCGGMVLLPEWKTSEGARIEVIVAKALGLQFFEAKWYAPGQQVGRWVIHHSSAPNIEAISLTVTPKTDADPKTTAAGIAAELGVKPVGIDQEARNLVYGARAATYGHPRGDFDRVAKMWSAILNHDVTSEQVAIMMVAFKLARLSQTPTHRDSQVDTIGYMLCLARLQEDPTEAEAWAKGVERAGTGDDVRKALEELRDTAVRAYAPDHTYANYREATDAAWAGRGFTRPHTEADPDHPFSRGTNWTDGGSIV